MNARVHTLLSLICIEITLGLHGEILMKITRPRIYLVSINDHLTMIIDASEKKP